MNVSPREDSLDAAWSCGSAGHIGIKWHGHEVRHVGLLSPAATAGDVRDTVAGAFFAAGKDNDGKDSSAHQNRPFHSSEIPQRWTPFELLTVLAWVNKRWLATWPIWRWPAPESLLLRVCRRTD